ncbi:MAG TPA: response regulator transcription factor [Firmicutes bacterium]|jgi:DNA-binding NarL/FixJ family response regulator|nr:response regulator transcription factor [Bacillota bacterium]
MMISVYIVDDHPFVREGLKTYLGTDPEIQVVGEAGNGENALPALKELDPDVAIIDLHLPKMSGVEIIKAIKESQLHTQVIILSSFCEDEEIIAAIDAGALSYLLKDSSPEKLLEAVKAAQRGEPVLHPRIVKKLMQRVSRKELQTEPLTLKETEVLRELVKGKSNKEIAADLFISETTVKTHVSNILQKLGVKDRTQAVIKALRLKLV